jgi:hypothetical protein
MCSVGWVHHQLTLVIDGLPYQFHTKEYICGDCGSFLTVRKNLPISPSTHIVQQGRTHGGRLLCTLPGNRRGSPKHPGAEVGSPLTMCSYQGVLLGMNIERERVRRKHCVGLAFVWQKISGEICFGDNFTSCEQLYEKVLILSLPSPIHLLPTVCPSF